MAIHGSLNPAAAHRSGSDAGNLSAIITQSGSIAFSARPEPALSLLEMRRGERPT